MNIKYKILSLLTYTLLASSLNAMSFEASVGTHDFIVSDIKDDTPNDGIDSGTSHTLGLNAAIYVKHTTKSGINLVAKAEAFLDNDKDHLDPDHIPVWFDFLVDIDGVIHRLNDNNLFKWYLLMDNKQNTVSCIEREVRQHLGVGYEYINGGLTLDVNAYSGFYYIEIDDDTPVARGYTRQQMDDGEASNMLQFTVAYQFDKHWLASFDARTYNANAGMENLENNFEFDLKYSGAYILTEGSTLNLKIKHVKYDLDRFYVSSTGLPILPFDNDTLVQAYVTLPIEF